MFAGLSVAHCAHGGAHTLPFERPPPPASLLSPFSPQIPPPTSLFNLEVQASDTAKTIASTLSGLLANKTTALEAALHPACTPSPASPSCTAETDPAYTDQFDAVSQTIIECTGVPVPTISNWAMGECGTRTTGDPRIFGPPTWRTFHIFAQNYPTEPVATVKTACIAFLKAIPYMLPCAHCGYDFQQFLAANELYASRGDHWNAMCAGSQAYNMPCAGPMTGACDSQSGLVNFFLRAHYNVDRLNKPCKKLWTPSMAAAAYGQVEDFCATCQVVGTKELCRSVGEKDCVVA